jgi:hypothetical protein
VAHCSNLTLPFSAVLRRGLAILFVAGAWPTVQAAPPSRTGALVAPQARFVKIERAFLASGPAPAPGAGVRSFEDSSPEAGGLERFDIRWYANPPGIPPGAVILLEAVQTYSPSVYNQAVRIPDRAQGHIRSVVEIPPEDIRRAGRVREWRISVVFRGRILARQTSPNWKG